MGSVPGDDAQNQREARRPAVPAGIADIQIAGSTSDSIAAGSAAARILPADAIAAGGGIAAGGTICAVSAGATAGVAAAGVLVGAAALGGIAFGAYKLVEHQHNDVKGAIPFKMSEGVSHGTWMVVTEEGIGNVKFYCFETEEHARHFFTHFRISARILLDMDGQERDTKGWNYAALCTLRRRLEQQ